MIVSDGFFVMRFRVIDFRFGFAFYFICLLWPGIETALISISLFHSVVQIV